jgi:multisubunit Na+/H+ antiporter MnhC subunit
MNSFSGIYVRLINLLARLFGALAFVAACVFLLSAYAFQADRWMHILLGLFLMAVGVALLIAKPVKVEIVANIGRRVGGSE